MTTTPAVRGSSGRSLFRSSLVVRATLSACTIGFALSPLAAQNTGSAEQLLRDAFWQQASGAVDSVVRQGFQKAVEASGSSTVRARALWLLAQHEMEHGRKEAAIRSLERLSVEFPDEGLLLASARRALADWTRADVALSFEEWDRQRKSSPEFFQLLVSRIEAMGKAKVSKERAQFRSDIMAMGSAAIPALQSAAAGGMAEVAREATRMLFRLKSIPPTIALLRSSDWLSSPTAWGCLMRLGVKEKGQMRDEMRKYRATDSTPFLQWVTQSQVSLPEFLHGVNWPSDLLDDFEEIAYAMYGGMDPHERPGIVSMARAQEVSPEIRRGLERAALSYGWPGASASQWITWGQGSLGLDGLIQAGWRAARCLSRDEFGSLKKLIELANEIPSDFREEYLGRLYESLGEVANPSQVPINRDILASMLDQLHVATPLRFFTRAANQDRFVDLLVETIFSSTKHMDAFAEETIGELIGMEHDGRWGRARRFVRAAFDWFDQRFKDWSPEHRRQALRTLAKEEEVVDLAGTMFETRLQQLIQKTGDPSIRQLLEDGDEKSKQKGADKEQPLD